MQGGTSGIGAAIVRALAARGAQIVILTQHAADDAFLVDFIEDMKNVTHNELIYAEQVDMSSLHSIRLFATKWVDNAPPRRLDQIVLCANTMTPYWGTSKTTVDGIEEEWMLDYLSNFHLLSILSPALRAQPPDRDVRILFSACSSYIGGNMDFKDLESPTNSGSTSYARSKLALMTFAYAFQKHLDAYKRPDKVPNNARALIVDPGYSRTPGTRRWLTGGSLIGLLIYLISYPIWWLLLKSAGQGAQSYLYASMEEAFGRGPGGKYIKECRELEPFRADIKDEQQAKELWEFSEKQIERLEKQGAVKRALEKKEAEEASKKGAKAEKGDSTFANGSATTSESKRTPRSKSGKKTG